MRRIILPLIKTSTIYLAVWTAMLSFQEVTMALFLSGPHNNVLSVSIWVLWEGGNLGTAAAGAVAMVATTGLLMFGILRLAGGPTAGLVGGAVGAAPLTKSQ
jgi:iron(III) transport system permease protein